MKEELNLSELSLSELVSDNEKFNSFIYTPFEEAVLEIKERWADKELEKKVYEYLNGDIPEPVLEAPRAVLFRQLCTPNYELSYFLNKIKGSSCDPLIFEYLNDKFTEKNPIKFALGQLIFQEEIKGSSNIIPKEVIDLQKNEGRKINEIVTKWGQPLVSFHHELLDAIYPGENNYLYDASDWFFRAGKYAREYYLKYISLFIRNGILFENFILSGEELNFTKEIFLPAFIDMWKKTGKKPLIVSLLPLESQNEAFWSNYSLKVLDCIKD